MIAQDRVEPTDRDLLDPYVAGARVAIAQSAGCIERGTVLALLCNVDSDHAVVIAKRGLNGVPARILTRAFLEFFERARDRFERDDVTGITEDAQTSSILPDVRADVEYARNIQHRKQRIRWLRSRRNVHAESTHDRVGTARQDGIRDDCPRQVFKAHCIP